MFGNILLYRTVEHTMSERASYAEIAGVGLQRASMGKVSSFEVSGKGLTSEDIDAKMTGTYSVN